MGKFNKGASTNLIHIISDCLFSLLAFELALLSSCTFNYREAGTFALECISGTKHGSNPTVFYLVITIVFTVIYLLASKESRLYNVTTFFYTDRIIRLISRSFFIAFAVEAVLIFYIGGVRLSGGFYILYLIYMYFFMIASAFLVRYTIKKNKRYSLRTLFVGDIKEYDKFLKFMQKGNSNINLVGYVSEWPTSEEGYLGSLENLEHIIHEQGIDQVYMLNSNGKGIDFQYYLNLCVEMGVTFRLVMCEYVKQFAYSYVSSIGTYPVITWHTVSLNVGSRALKRIMDIFGSLVGIILSSPVMLLTAIAIKLDSPGPVIFKQERVGQNGRHFFMYKFRSMCKDAEAMKAKLAKQNEMAGGFMFKMHDDPRITKVGRFIRKTSIDELPQFFNVLLGSMSLVGTRPPTLDEVDKYERNHWRRMSIKPGITGMWQVSGRSSVKNFDEIVQLDTEYIDKWSIFLDIRILLLTVVKVFKRDGAC